MWWLVSPQNPLKAARGMAPLATRLRIARARAHHPAIRVTGLESALATRYTADTLAVLRRRFPARRFVWLMGADNLAQFPRWERWEEIFRRVPIAVFDRSPYSFQALAGKAATRFLSKRHPARRARLLADAPPPAWVFLHQRRHPASATALRLASPLPDFNHA